MTAIALPKPLAVDASSGQRALNAAARLWFAVAVAGQWLFLYYIVAFYGPSTVTGNFQAWTRNKLLPRGYVPGDTAGNLTFAAHALFAGVIAFGGALQLMPEIRRRAIGVHRWIGRLFLVTAIGESISGLYLVWVRHANKDLLGSLGVSLNGVLILLFAALAWRTALARDAAAHRRWALRTYLVANGQWFTRVGFFVWAIVTQGHYMRPFFRFWGFGSYLLPLLVLELYLAAQTTRERSVRLEMAALLVILTLLMAGGIAGASLFYWKQVLGGA